MSYFDQTDQSEDVTDFLRRVRELGEKRDNEDDERRRKLEEDIAESRRLREAKRAERARSLSPEKDSPSSRTSAPPRSSPRVLPQSRREMQADASHAVANKASTLSSAPALNLNDNIRRRTDSLSAEEPSKLESPAMERPPSPTKPSPSAGVPLSRTGTLSWQQRPASLLGPRSRPLSMVGRATPGTPTSKVATPDETDAEPITRNQISQALAAKDPSWFRQTADRNVGSPALRKTRDEEVDSASSTTGMESMAGRYALHGLSRDSTPSLHGATSPEATFVSESSALGGSRPSSMASATAELAKFADRFPPPERSFSNRSNTDNGKAEDFNTASRSRYSRPESPTKGMGGFVQSAMLKRSDSLNKRWSAQAAPVLSRQNSHRSANNPTLQSSISMPRLGETSRDNSQEPESRPGSSYSNATTIRQSSPVRSNHHRSQSSTSTDVQSPPSSTKRWSPVKSSWLESALSKPELSSPSPSLGANQPSWMLELAKSKQQRRVNGESPTRAAGEREFRDIGASSSPPDWTSTEKRSLSTARTHGGLPAATDRKDTPPSAAPISNNRFSAPKSTSASPFESLRSSRPSSPTKDVLSQAPQPVLSTKPVLSTDAFSRSGSDPLLHTPNTKTAPVVPIKSVSISQPEKSSADASPAKEKPITPPKKDFRGTLKSRNAPIESPKKEEPEFKNVFGNLKRTKTVNYVAPDELKSNILRGKAGLVQTDGPKKTERRDELKEDLLKQKEVMKARAVESKAPPPGKPSGSVTPEAIAKRKALGSDTSLGNAVNSPTRPPGKMEPVLQSPLVQEVREDALQHTKSAPSMLQTKPSSNKLAERFNPALASMLARGPPATNGAKETSSPSSFPGPTVRKTDDKVGGTETAAGELQHMTKSRARGPKRRVPKSGLALSDEPIAQTVQPTTSAASSSKPVVPVKSRNLTPIASTLSTKANEPNITRPAEVASKPSETSSHSLPHQRPPWATKPQPVTTSNTTQSAGLVQSARTQPAFMSKSPRVSSNIFSADKIEGQDSSAISVSQRSVKTPIEKSPPQTKPPAKTEESSQPASTLASQSVSLAEDSAAPVQSTSVKAASASWGKKWEAVSPADKKQPSIFPTDMNSKKASTPIKARPEEKNVRTNSPTRSAITSMVATENDLPGRQPAMHFAGLPHIPSKPPMAADKPQSAAKPESAKVTNAAASQASPPGVQLFSDFFDETPIVPKELDVDVSAVFAAGSKPHPQITTLRKQMSEISRGGKTTPVTSGQEHILLSDRVYVCTHVFRDEESGARVTEVYLWAGSKVSDGQIEDSQLFARGVAKDSNTKLIVFKQGKESANFLQALGGIVIIRDGKSTPYMLCGRQHLGHLVFDEVSYSSSTLCSAFPFIVAPTEKDVYLWKGAGASINEIGGAKLIAMDLCHSGQFSAEVDEGSETAEFLATFAAASASSKPPTVPRSAGHWKLKPTYEQYCCRLFRVDYNDRPVTSQGTGTGSSLSSWGMSLMRRQSQAPSTNVDVTEITPFTQHDMASDNIYVLDAWFEMYIILSPLARSKASAFASALLFAQEYSLLASSAQSRPHVPFASVVLEGAPKDMKVCFRAWEEKADTSLLMAGKPKRAGSLKVVGLKEALGALKTA